MGALVVSEEFRDELGRHLGFHLGAHALKPTPRRLQELHPARRATVSHLDQAPDSNDGRDLEPILASRRQPSRPADLDDGFADPALSHQDLGSLARAFDRDVRELRDHPTQLGSFRVVLERSIQLAAERVGIAKELRT
jgi:hypothetical protein